MRCLVQVSDCTQRKYKGSNIDGRNVHIRDMFWEVLGYFGVSVADPVRGCTSKCEKDTLVASIRDADNREKRTGV